MGSSSEEGERGGCSFYVQKKVDTAPSGGVSVKYVAFCASNFGCEEKDDALRIGSCCFLHISSRSILYSYILSRVSSGNFFSTLFLNKSWKTIYHRKAHKMKNLTDRT